MTTERYTYSTPPLRQIYNPILNNTVASVERELGESYEIGNRNLNR